MHSPEELQEARDRDGAPADDRPDRVDSYLSEIEQEPVEWEGSDLTDPENYEALRKLCEHPQVADREDVAEAIPGASESDVRRLLRLHGLEVKSPETEEQSEYVDVPLAEPVPPEHLRTPLHEDARLLEHLYIGCGLGTRQIADVVSHVRAELHPDASPASTGVDEWDVRQALEAVGLVPSAEADDGGRNEYGVDGRFDTTLMHREPPDLTIDADEVDAWEAQPAGNDPE